MSPQGTNKLRTPPVKEGQREFFKGRMEMFGNVNSKAMQTKLLAIAGNFLVLQPENPEDTKRVLKEGKLFVHPVRIKRGAPSACHENSSNIYLEHNPKFVLCTGYVYHQDDGLWRQHSWLIDSKSRHIVETTSNRDAYYGVELAPEEALRFAISNMHEAKCSKTTIALIELLRKKYQASLKQT